MSEPQTITFTIQRPETRAVIEAIPAGELDSTLEDYILLADRVLRTVRLSERDALSEIFDRFEGIQNRLDTAVGQLSKSQAIGALGEEQVLLDLNATFGPADRFERVGQQAHVGDILGRLGNGEKILVEVKKYRNPVPKKEIDKFWRDMWENNHTYGLFVSLQSAISGMPTENFAYRQDGPRRAVFVVNTAFDNVGHRMGLEYLKRLIELDRLSGMAPAQADLAAKLARIADQLNHIRDNLNLATDIQATAQEATSSTQRQMAHITERIIELRVRTRNSLEAIDRILADLSGSRLDPPPADDPWLAILDQLEDGHKMAAPLRTVCAGLVGHRLEFECGQADTHQILHRGRPVGALKVQKTKLTILTNLELAEEQAAPLWSPARHKDYCWQSEINSQDMAGEKVAAIAQALTIA